jgi:hypothetical protein
MGALDSPMRHRTVTVPCLVRTTSAQPLGFRAVDRWRRLSSSCIGQSGATPDSPVLSDFCAALFRSDISTVDRWFSREPLLRWLTGQSSGTPDSSVNYSGARLHFPESGWFNSVRPWCSVRHFSAHSRSFCSN